MTRASSGDASLSHDGPSVAAMLWMLRRIALAVAAIVLSASTLCAAPVVAHAMAVASSEWASADSHDVERCPATFVALHDGCLVAQPSFESDTFDAEEADLGDEELATFTVAITSYDGAASPSPSPDRVFRRGEAPLDPSRFEIRDSRPRGPPV